MTPDTFLREFGHLVDAPDGVQKLRDMIRQFAVRGNLVEQDPSDESAQELVEKIVARKQQLVSDGLIKRQRELPKVSFAQYPYELPRGWVFIRLGNIVNRIGSGSTPRGGKSAYVESGVPFLRSQNVWNDRLHLDNVAYIPPDIHRKMSNTVVVAHDILLNITGASLGRCAVYPEDFGEANVSQHVSIIRPTLADTRQFLHCCILSPYVQKLVWKRQVGMAREGLSKKVLEQFEFPFPPLAEQKRIVAKVDELMALCDELEARHTKRNETRVRLNNASLDALVNAQDPDELAHHWSRLDENFEELCQAPESIQSLRESILDLASTGKLQSIPSPRVPAHDTKNASRSRVSTSATRQLASKIKAIVPNDIPFPLPNGWNWSRLGSHVLDLRYGTSKKCSYEQSGTPVIRIPNLSSGMLSSDDLKFATFAEGELEKLSLETDDILMIRSNGSVGLVGRTARVSSEFEGYAFAGYLVRIRVNSAQVRAGYIEKVLNTTLVRRQIERPIRTTSGVKNINSTEILNLLLPIAPFEKQNRIVAKVDELMTLCNALESKLTTAQTTSQHLLDASIKAVIVA